MEPSAEEVELPGQEVFLLFRTGKPVKVGYAHVGLADAIPAGRPQAVAEAVAPGLEVVAVHPTALPAVEAALPSPEVTVVYLVDHVIVDAHVLYFVFSPVPRVGPITLVEFGNAVVKLFGESLKVLEVFVGIHIRDVRVRRLIEIIGASCQTKAHRQHTASRYDIFIEMLFHCPYCYKLILRPKLKRFTVG